tara:strand:+ start:317 stop:571 length:255 start_codon:yes stop_codon:yes gene_type:complete
MTGEEVEIYIKEDLGHEPRHNVDALASAISIVASKVDHNEYELMQLLLDDKPIPKLMTHSYGFHTHSGRELIEGMKNYYYEENN